MRLLFMADFSEQFPNRVLKGIRKFSQSSGEPWVVCKMPPSFGGERDFGQLVSWAEKWGANVVLAPFSPDDDVDQFRQKGIVAIAIDNVRPFTQIPNLTADYQKMGEMVAKRFVKRGFTNFAFFGYRGVCWSDGRRRGFIDYLDSQGFKDNCLEGARIRTDSLWSYDEEKLGYWLLTLPKPIGIMACDDTQANILLECCHTFGINVPSEVAVIGVDNDEMLCSMTDPPLSSLDVDMEGGGYTLAQMAERMVKDPEYHGEDIVLQPIDIVTRQSSNVMATNDKYVQMAIRFISANIDRRIGVKDVLDAVPMSRRSLEQRFQKATGQSVYEYISHRRIDAFAQRLLESSEPVSVIAAQMDDADAKSITRRFVSFKGCTPTEYRRKYLRKLGG